MPRISIILTSLMCYVAGLCLGVAAFRLWNLSRRWLSDRRSSAPREP